MITRKSTAPDVLNILFKLKACQEARDWVVSHKGNSYALWRGCKRGDWLLWFTMNTNVDRQLVTLAACDCAESTFSHLPKGEKRPHTAIKTARRWAHGKATIEDVKEAAQHAGIAASHSIPEDGVGPTASTFAAAAAQSAARSAFLPTAYASALYTTRALSPSLGVSEAHLQSARLVRSSIPWSSVKEALSL